MTECIERGAAINEFAIRSQFYDAECGNKRFTPDDVETIIRSIPAADVRPVVRGKWELEYEPNGKPYCFHCSICDGDFHYIGITTKYDFCPNCGADMREPPKEE